MKYKKKIYVCIYGKRNQARCFIDDVRDWMQTPFNIMFKIEVLYLCGDQQLVTSIMFKC